MILQIDSLAFSYNCAPVLNDVTFSVPEHAVTAILGPNGAGKTTLLRCINRILKPQTGTVMIGDEELSSLGRRKLARQVAYVSQRSEPVRVTAFDAVLLGRKPYIRWNVSEKDIKAAQAVMRRLGLEKLSLRYIDEMSGGEYQKVCIARALVQDPAVMLLDEPTSSLDLKNQLSILRLLRDIVRGHKMCAVITMHDLNTAFRYADHFIFLKNGTIHGTADRSSVTEAVIEEVYGVPVKIERHQDHPFILPMDDNGYGKE